ncbi:lmo0937 family membrane protein [Belliella sp. DSM 107340]|uniref:Lmo0937 family membrane protein n=1 Tax=Belliella calami TaxID=2923436 RepID=A0ABS9UNZ5_9BACT|nr:lmo0937 family membrane protein [Belliella calami]MCH7398179.1 lmo0937 family membrane protein [Belliella calami]
MGNLLYIIAVILIIGWIFGAFVYSVGGLIHILLVLAVISILFRIISGRRV